MLWEKVSVWAKRLLLGVTGSSKAQIQHTVREGTRRTAVWKTGEGRLHHEKVAVARSLGAGEGWPPQTQHGGRKGELSEQSEREGQRLWHCRSSPTGPSCGNWQHPRASNTHLAPRRGLQPSDPAPGTAALRRCAQPGAAALQRCLKCFTCLSASQNWSFIQAVY